MANLDKKLVNRSLRAARVRAKVSGTAERPRLSVTISNMHVSAQLIDDVKQHTIAAATTVGTKQTGTMTEQAALIGAEVAKKAKMTTNYFAMIERGEVNPSFEKIKSIAKVLKLKVTIS